MNSKPTRPHRAAAAPPSTMLSDTGVRGCTWVVATALCSGFWLRVGELVFA